MSTVLEKVSDEINVPEKSQQEMKKRRPSGKHPYKPHLATKVKWALEDSMKELVAAEQKMRIVLAWLEETYGYDIDDRARAHLGKLEHQLLGVALDVSKAKEVLAAALAESKPAE